MADARHGLTMRPLVRNWIAANALGEILGLGLAAIVAIAVAQAHAFPPAEELLVVTAAFLVIGAYEGAVVGAAQWLVLRRVLPGIGARSWITATMAGAVIAWMLGRIPSALADAGASPGAEPPMAIILPLSAAAGAVLGVILGGAQWFVLRDHVPRARLWIGANALAWAAGMPMIFLAAGIAGPDMSTFAIAAIVLVAVGIAGVVVGAIEGAFLIRLTVGAWRTG